MEQLSRQEKRVLRILKRDELIKEMFERLSSKKIGRAQKYSNEAILVMIADKFFLSEKTVEDILCNRVNYKSKQVEE